MGIHKGIKALPIYGGAGYAEQLYGLKSGTFVVVGTPGRIVDHINRGTLKLNVLTTLVLDEADEMISMGFKEDLQTILSQAPRESSNIWLFSATMSRDVRRVADDYLKSPKQVQVNRTEMLSGTVEQLYYRAQESDKPEILCKLIDAADDFYGLVFCQTKALVVDLTQYLLERNYKVDCLHGDKDQNARDRSMRAFRDRKVTLLICTDVASRGLDVKDITHVINYSLPRELDIYVHRIGRTGRSGKAGIAMSLVTQSHRILVSKLEQLTKTRMTEGRIPSRREIGERRIAQSLDKFKSQTLHLKAMEFITPAWREALSDMSEEEVVGRFLCLSFPEWFEENKPIRDQPTEQIRRPRERPPRDHKRTDDRGPRHSRDRQFEQQDQHGYSHRGNR